MTSWNGDGRGDSGDETDGEPLIIMNGEVVGSFAVVGILSCCKIYDASFSRLELLSTPHPSNRVGVTSWLVLKVVSQ